MIRVAKRITCALLAAFLVLMLLSTPVLAIGDPDSIAFNSAGSVGRYKAFYNVYETGDMLFIAETFVYYATPPTDYNADEAYLFELRSTDNTTVYRATGITDYGNRVISIYQTAAQVTALGLTADSAYYLRITGNPAIFSTLTEGTNMTTKPLSTADWVDQSTATDSDNPLRDFVILVVNDLEDYDSPATSYIGTIQGVEYLSTTGGSIFLDGIPSLQEFCPSAFTATVSTIEITDPPTTGALQTQLSIVSKLGTNAATAMTNLGTWLGISQRIAGSLSFLLAVLILCFYIGRLPTGAGVLISIVALLGSFGVYLGLIPVAAGFVALMAIVVLSAYFYFAKGTLG